MGSFFEKKINYWTFLIQKKYIKYFTIEKKKFLEQINFSPKSKISSRVILGGFKFLPISIYFLIRNLPMPWNLGSNLKTLIHKNGTIYLVCNKNKTLDHFFFPRWSLVNRLIGKRKKFLKLVSKINFSLSENEESFESHLQFNYSKIFNFNFKKNIELDPILRDIFFNQKANFASQAKNFKKNFFFIDLTFLISINKISIDPFIMGAKKKARNIKKDNEELIKLKYFFRLKKKKSLFFKEKKNLSKSKNCYRIYFPFLYEIKKSNIKDFFTLSFPFNNFDFYKNTLKFDFKKKKSYENHFSRNKFYFEKSKENLVFFVPRIIPFFKDLFFSQKRVSIHFYLFKKKINLNKSFSKIMSIYDIPVIKRLIIEFSRNSNTRFSMGYKYLLKNYFKNVNLKNKLRKKQKINFLKIFKNNIFFEISDLKWIEIGKNICKKSHQMMNLILGRKNLTFLNLDKNFNLKPIKTLTTKERKKSRFSNTFHLSREILRFSKILVDSHIRFTKGNLAIFGLIDIIYYILTHMGHLTGIYRYKYKIMKQIRICKSLDSIFKQINRKGEKKYYCGQWAPIWRIWVFFLRGTYPLLERWLSNLLVRYLNGRKNSKKSVSLKKQRDDAYFDIQIKTDFLNEIKNSKSNIKPFKIKLFLNKTNEAWKCWKSNLPLKNLPNLGKFERLVFKFIKKKSEWWIKKTYVLREKIRRGMILDKITMKKNLGRISRLWFKSEQKKQHEYIENGPFFSEKQVDNLCIIFSKWLDLCQHKKLDFPLFLGKKEIKILNLSLESIKNEKNISCSIKKKTIKDEVYLEKFFFQPLKTLEILKENILYQKTFNEAEVYFVDHFTHLIPVYQIIIEEKLIDSFIDHYLWFKIPQNSLFPEWTKPSDNEIAPFLIHKFIYQLKKKYCSMEKNYKKDYQILKGKINNCLENIEIPFLNKILMRIMDVKLASYLTVRNNLNIVFKDMSYLNCMGLIKGLKFSGFLIQVYFLLFDLLFLGIEKIYSMILNKTNKKVLKTKNKRVFLYFRYLSNIFFISELWKNLILELEKRVPFYFGNINIKNFDQNKKQNLKCNSFLKLDICGFDILIKSNIIPFSSKKNLSKYTEQKFRLIINENTIQQFEGKVKQLLISSSSTTFTKISNKWNSVLLGITSYFREACNFTTNFLNSSCLCENTILTRIKMAFNSKMPSRFPPVLFYAPKELGGLGILSISSPMIPENDLKYSKLQNKSPLNLPSYENIVKNQIPSLEKHILSWKEEFQISKHTWLEFLRRRNFFRGRGKMLVIKDIGDLWNKGVPRINTLFQKNRSILAYDLGWRLRLNMIKYQQIKKNPFWWTNQKHDGKLWCLKIYKEKILFELGGIENILEHTLFGGTYFPTWEGLFWEKATGFEESLKFKKLTNAQRSGLNQIPNRRFTLWWSPTINRGNVYIGFQVQLDLSGIFMHGKIPTLKISFIQIFRGHLWQKIHESLVIFFSTIFDQNINYFKIQAIQKEQNHPRKAYKMTSSSADIIVYSGEEWKFYKPSLVTSLDISNITSYHKLSNIYWVDVQLRWGDFDAHDIERYCRTKFFDYSDDQNTVYPSKTGSILSIDLAYNIISGYGYWINGLKKIILNNLKKLMKTNPALFILRERLRKSLQLYITETNQRTLTSKNLEEIFKKKNIWIIEDKSFYRVAIHQTSDENMVSKPLNGCLMIFIPQKGNLILKIVGRHFWKQQKRLSQIAKWKAAEEISNLIYTLPISHRPDEIITTRKTLIDPIRVQLIDYPEILIKNTEIKVSLHCLLRINKFRKTITETISSENLIFNLYDDWLSKISTYTSFSRLILILRGIEVNFFKVREIFMNSFDNTISDFFWPVFDENGWIKVEIKLKNLILEIFSKKNFFLNKNFSQNEIRDIILIGNCTSKKSVLPENIYLDKRLHINLLKDFKGRKIKVSNNNKGSPPRYISLSIWKISSFNGKKIDPKTYRVKTRSKKKNKNKKKLIIPRNIIKELIYISNLEFNILAILFGKSLPKKDKITEIKILFIPPQINRKNFIDFIFKIPKHKILRFFYMSGFVCTSGIKMMIDYNFKKKTFLRSMKNFKILVLILLCISERGCKIKSIKLKKKSKNQVEVDKKRNIQIFISKNFFGIFVIPSDKSWNFFYKFPKFIKTRPSCVIIKKPGYFLNFIKH
jgi:pre-mRNA-processing factor 8